MDERKNEQIKELDFDGRIVVVRVITQEDGTQRVYSRFKDTTNKQYLIKENKDMREQLKKLKLALQDMPDSKIMDTEKWAKDFSEKMKTYREEEGEDAYIKLLDRLHPLTEKL